MKLVMLEVLWIDLSMMLKQKKKVEPEGYYWILPMMMMMIGVHNYLTNFGYFRVIHYDINGLWSEEDPVAYPMIRVKEKYNGIINTIKEGGTREQGSGGKT